MNMRDEIEACVNEVLSGSHDPFDPGNLIEALQEAGDRQDKICQYLAVGEYAQAGKLLAKVTSEYWRYWAEVAAERKVHGN